MLLMDEAGIDGTLDYQVLFRQSFVKQFAPSRVLQVLENVPQLVDPGVLAVHDMSLDVVVREIGHQQAEGGCHAR